MCNLLTTCLKHPAILPSPDPRGSGNWDWLKAPLLLGEKGWDEGKLLYIALKSNSLQIKKNRGMEWRDRSAERKPSLAGQRR